MSNSESRFWDSFTYNHETNIWSLAARVAPMDILEVCRLKLEADRAAVEKLLSGELRVKGVPAGTESCEGYED